MKSYLAGGWFAGWLAVALNTAAQSSTGGSEAPAQYVVRTGDRLQYRVAEDPVRGNAPLVVAVNSVGEASFPVSRNSDIRVTFVVRGKTVDEVRTELRRQLLVDYYHKATVELSLAEKVLVPGKIQFFGEMSATIPIQPDSPPLSLSEAVLSLRPSDFADLRRIKVHRLDPVTQKSRVIEVDVNAILKRGQRDRDIILQDGDRVEVLQKWFN